MILSLAFEPNNGHFYICRIWRQLIRDNKNYSVFFVETPLIWLYIACLILFFLDTYITSQRNHLRYRIGKGLGYFRYSSVAEVFRSDSHVMLEL